MVQFRLRARRDAYAYEFNPEIMVPMRIRYNFTTPFTKGDKAAIDVKVATSEQFEEMAKLEVLEELFHTKQNC